jgi:hypothetical protein
MLKLYHEATQMLCSCVHPKLDQGDHRYDTQTEESDPRFMRYEIQSKDQSGPSEAEERKGVLHLVQGWIQQKQPEKVSLGLVPVRLWLNGFALKGSFFILRIYS